MLENIKGMHPGFFLERKLKEKNISKGRLALKINEYPQTLSAITKGKRGMNTALALKIENELGLPEGTLMFLHIFYDIKQEKLKRIETSKPNLSKLRKILFWDTDFNKIQWHTQKKAVIERVFDRGNEKEKAEITRFYGKETVDKILKEYSAHAY
ncbi:MAG: plasmid maintenance system antidote protein [Bacteroidetes bacterium]|nr:plasmid maintenance system antidote protein [Bacteroidota bacterium]